MPGFSLRSIHARPQIAVRIPLLLRIRCSLVVMSCLCGYDNPERRGYKEIADRTERLHGQKRSDWNQALSDSQGNRLGAGGSTEFVKNRADVELDSVLGDPEASRNIFVDESFG